jgi:peroxiredoxin (alkyl hydroperoxide reductase subunit C)
MGLVAVAQPEPKIPLIGESSPRFRAQSTQGVLNFPEDFGDHWKLIISFPKDFTPVCSSELLELACRQDDFKALNVDILVLSTDSLEYHKLWMKSLEKLCYKGREPRSIDFPMLADQDYKITRKLGMLHYPYSTNRDIRGVFLIDPKNTIRYLQFCPYEIGQNIEELKRLVMALQKHDAEQVYTPANWQPGEDVIVPYAVDIDVQDPNICQLTWYLTFKRTEAYEAPPIAREENMDSKK